MEAKGPREEVRCCSVCHEAQEAWPCLACGEWRHRRTSGPGSHGSVELKTQAGLVGAGRQGDPKRSQEDESSGPGPGQAAAAAVEAAGLHPGWLLSCRLNHGERFEILLGEEASLTGR